MSRPDPFTQPKPDRLSAEQTDAWRQRQRNRSLWTALILGALVLLIFFVAWRKMLVG